MVFPLSKNIFIYRPLPPSMVFPLPKHIFIYRPLPPSMVFPVSKLILFYQPLVYLDGISSIQTYIHLPTTYLPRWYFLYSNLYSFTNHLYPSMVFPLPKLILIYRPLSPLMVVPLPKLILIYRPLSPLMVFPVSKLILFYQPLVYLDGISSIQTYIHLPTTYLPQWYFLYQKIYSFTIHLSTLMVFPLPKHIFIYRPLPPSEVFRVSKLIFIYQPLIYLDGISSIQKYIHSPTTYIPRWYFLYPKIYSFTDHCLP